MSQSHARNDAKSALLTGLGLLTAAAFVFLSFAGDAVGAVSPADALIKAATASNAPQVVARRD
jgi:hypothetical protein